MAKTFYIPEGTVFSEPPPPAPVPQPTPEEAEANDARVRDLNNQFIDDKQQLLYTAPQAFLRQQGSDAIARAGEADEILDTLRQQTLDQAANAHQRTRLAGMLDWHLADAKEQVRRHVVEQSDVWQQSVAARTVELATKQAALESGDAEKVGFVALAAYDAEKARAIKQGLAPKLAHESGRAAWSGAYQAAIETQTGTDPLQAVRLFDQAQATFDPQTREALQPRIDDLSRGAQANALADKALAPGADRAALLDDADVPPEVRQLAESKIAMRETAVTAARQSQIDTLDSRLGRDTPQALAGATYTSGTYAAIANGYAAAGDIEKATSARRLAENETLLTGFAGMTPTYQDVTLDKLEPGPVRDQALGIKEATDRMLANDPLRWGTTTQRANGVGELVPLDLTPSPTNTPQAIAAALGQREQQARHIELLLPSPAMTEEQIAEVSRPRLLPMTQEEIAAFKRMLDETPPGQQSKLIVPLAGLSSEAIPGMAQALAGGDSGDARGRSYAAALTLLGGGDPQQATVADQILRGAQIRKDESNAAPASSDAWQRALQGELKSVQLDTGRMAPAIATDAITAVYAWQMSQQGRLGATLYRDVLDKAIVAVTGGPAARDGQALSPAGYGVDESAPAEADNVVEIAQQPELPTESIGGPGVAPKVEPPPDSPEFQTAMTKGVGHIARLPDGSTIPDDNSPTGYVMTPIDNLSEVAAAGRNVGADYARVLNNPQTAPLAILTLGAGLGVLVGQGGKFDYQREGNRIKGYEQLRHFKNIANVNVGLAAQQAGLSLHDVLSIAGRFAALMSSNADPTKPYGLETKTREFIETGYNVGKSGVFGPPASPPSMAGSFGFQAAPPSER
jgi:hypothetical protein